MTDNYKVPFWDSQYNVRTNLKILQYKGTETKVMITEKCIPYKN
jgi:hypothetical protein